MDKNKTVYILGAGSSKDFGLPLGNEFFEAADKLLVKAENDVSFQTIFRPVFDKANTDINKLYFNLPDNKLEYPPLEEVLTLIYEQIEYQSRLEHQAYEAKHFGNTAPGKEPLFENGIKNAFDNLVNLMLLTILGSRHFYCRDAEIMKYEAFIKSLNFNDQDISFISLNYDTILDDILLKCKKGKTIDGFNYGLYPQNIDDENSEIDGSVYLLKPHGSMNLLYCPHMRARSLAPGFYFSENTDRFYDLISKRKKVNCPWPHCGNSPTPLIIPPIYNKKTYIRDVTSRTQPKTGFWPRDNPEMYRFSVDRKMLEILEFADEVVVIGYSMPAYDTDFKGLVINGLMCNKNREKLCIKIITKREENDNVKNIVKQYEHLVKNVVIEGEDGFLNYIKSRIL